MGETLRVLVISSVGTPTLGDNYSGLENIAGWQAIGLDKLGHEVSIALSVDSPKSAFPKSVKTIPTVFSRMAQIPEKEHFETLASKVKWQDYDAVIDNTHGGWSKTVQKEQEHWYFLLHNDPSHLGQPPPVRWPGIVGPTLDNTNTYCEKFAGTVYKTPQGDRFFGAVARTVYHGIPVKDIKFNPKGGDRYLFLGRIQSLKGAHVALDVCKALDLPLDIIGADDHLGPAADNQYVQRIKNQCDGKKWRYFGKIPNKEKFAALGNAKALIAPSTFREPFGLMSIEAQAAGTPAIVSGIGGLPETVRHGTSGFVFSNLAELRNHLLDIEDEKIKVRSMRKATRQWVESNFTIETMVRQWDRLFHSAPF